MDKLKKAPSIVWYVVLVASLFLKSFYSIRESIKIMPELMMEFGFDEELVAQALGSMSNTLFYIINILIALVFFEVMVYLAYNTFAKRRFLTLGTTKNDFALPIRVMYSLGNIASGLFSLLYFRLPELALYSSSLIVFAADTAALLLAYMIIKDSGLIAKGGLKASFSFFYRTYGGIFLALAVLNLFSSLGSDRVILILQIGNLILVMLFFLVAWNIQTKLAKEDKDNIDNLPPPEPREIFKGFGF